MKNPAQSIVQRMALLVFLGSSVAGCYNTTAAPLPRPNAPIPSGVDRVVLVSGEIIPLDDGQYELREEGLLLQTGGSSRDAVRVIPRSDIAYLETRHFSKGKTLLGGLAAYAGLFLFVATTGLLGAQ